MTPGRAAGRAGDVTRVRFAGMFPGDYEPNPLTRLLARQRAAGTPLIDLTESNPAVHGLSPDPLCLAPATASGLRRYRPEPRGAPAAREAVAGYYRERGISTLAERVVLTASTSEAYGWLLKLLCEPGDRVLAPAPGYLFDAEQPAVALSLLTAPEEFAAGIACLVAALQDQHPGAAV